MIVELIENGLAAIRYAGNGFKINRPRRDGVKDLPIERLHIKGRLNNWVFIVPRGYGDKLAFVFFLRIGKQNYENYANHLNNLYICHTT